jgi:RNA polymerase sigma-70 factor, ECF subfamily
MLVTMSDSPASASAADPLPFPVEEGRGEGAADLSESPASEAHLLRQAAAGNSAAFDRLVTVHQERISRLVHRLLGWPSDVDDVVQDVFVDVLRNLNRFDGRSSVLTWLTRIAINRCRSHQRKEWLRSTFLRRLPLSLGEGRGEGAANQLETSETIQQVHQAIQQLKQSDREIIVLRYLEEQSIEQIAQTLGSTRGTVDVRLSRARKRLEKILQPILEK